MNTDTTMSVSAAAALLGVSAPRVYQLRSAGRIVGTADGVRLASVEAYAASRRPQKAGKGKAAKAKGKVARSAVVKLPSVGADFASMPVDELADTLEAVRAEVGRRLEVLSALKF